MMIIYYLTLLKHNIAYRLPHLLPSAGPTDNLREYANPVTLPDFSTAIHTKSCLVYSICNVFIVVGLCSVIVFSAVSSCFFVYI